MNIKVRTYYKQLYSNGNYVILYTGNKWIYIIMAVKYVGKPLVKVKYDKKFKWRSIKDWRKEINRNKFIRNKIEEMSKGDLFLELL